MDYKDYYKTLGVARDAKLADIKTAYRKLARKYHPDVSKEPNAEEQFKTVAEAYEVLKDPEKRRAYDQLGSQWQGGQEFKPPPGYNGGENPFYSQGEFQQQEFSGFSDFFSSLFGGGGGFADARRGQARGQSMQMKGESLQTKIKIPLEDAYHGAVRTLHLQMPVMDEQGHVTRQDKTINVKIPAGVSQGQQIRLKGQGGPGVMGGPNGDLFMEVEIEPHRLFRVDGRDIHVKLPIAPWEAALGAKISVPTPKGKVDLKVPEQSQTGKKFRLKGWGIPGKQAGDLYVILEIVAPPADTDKDKELYTQMQAQFASFNPRKDMEI